MARASRPVPLVEDAAQAIGASWQGRPVGAWGDVACLSFYPTKNLGACGDGGMLADRPRRRRRARPAPAPPRRRRPLPPPASSAGAAGSTSCRRPCCGSSCAGSEDGSRRAAASPPATASGWPACPLALPGRAAGRAPRLLTSSRAPSAARRVRPRRLADLGVGTTVHYPIAVPDQPMFGDARTGAAERWPESARAAREVVSLPCYPELTRRRDRGRDRAVRPREACRAVGP